MATSSFTKDFTLQTKKEIDSFLSILENPPKSKIKTNRNIMSPEKEKWGEIKLKQMLSR